MLSANMAEHEEVKPDEESTHNELEKTWVDYGPIHICTSFMDIVVDEIFVLPDNNGFQFMHTLNGKDIFCSLTSGGVLIEESEQIMTREMFHENVELQKQMMVKRINELNNMAKVQKEMNEQLATKKSQDPSCA